MSVTKESKGMKTDLIKQTEYGCWKINIKPSKINKNNAFLVHRFLKYRDSTAAWI